MDVLRDIDRAIDGLCPCGAGPRPGSAYCSDDCVPTHRSADTTSDIDGTAMRWRPDLVTETEDIGLTLVNQSRRGPLIASVYEAVFTPIEGWRRLCYRCGEREAPIAGRRTLRQQIGPWTHESTDSFRPTQVEDCDLCGACRHPFPGPPLIVSRHDDRSVNCQFWRMRLGGTYDEARIYNVDLERAPDAGALVRLRLEEIEMRLLADYARRNPDQAGVVEWLESHDVHALRLLDAQIAYIRAHGSRRCTGMFAGISTA